MHPYLLLPLLAAVLGAGFGAVILGLGPRQRPNQTAAALLFGASFWGGCEVLWNTAADAETALQLHRVSALGWVFLGPNAVTLVCSLTEVSLPRIQRALPALYLLDAGFLLAAWTSDAMLAGMVRTPFGWGLVPGPLFGAWFALTTFAVAVGLTQWVRVYRRAHSSVDREAGARTGLYAMAPFALGSLTDGLLPLFDVQWPRVGSLSCASVGLVALWGLRRYGYTLLDGESFSQHVLRTLPDGVALTSLNGRIRLANTRMDELLGCRSGEAVGLALADHVDLPLLDPPRELREGECELVQVSGRRIPVAISAAPLTARDDELHGLVLIVRDRREIAGLRLRLITSGRLAAVGELAAGIAHEINNPLAFVRANLGHLRREWELFAAGLDKPEVDGGLRDSLAEWGTVLEESLDGVDRASAIVRDVRDFSHAGSEERELADLNELVEAALRMGTHQLAPGVQIERSFGELPAVPCSPQRLKQLFLNLIVNAIQAVGEEGRIRVETAESGALAVVTVLDDGCGIAPEDLDRVFDPFFTTKPAGEGTGLGLAISHEIARSHGGSIRVDSEPGRGTRVRVELPLA
jgi:PAS domain S-box-containing protein